jgi:hypothetical protein
VYFIHQERNAMNEKTGRKWTCLGYDPLRWGYGQIVDGYMEPVATIMRQADGSWDWWIGTWKGRALESRAAAMAAVKKELDRARSVR